MHKRKEHFSLDGSVAVSSGLPTLLCLGAVCLLGVWWWSRRSPYG